MSCGRHRASTFAKYFRGFLRIGVSSTGQAHCSTGKAAPSTGSTRACGESSRSHAARRWVVQSSHPRRRAARKFRAGRPKWVKGPREYESRGPFGSTGWVTLRPIGGAPPPAAMSPGHRGGSPHRLELRPFRSRASRRKCVGKFYALRHPAHKGFPYLFAQARELVRVIHRTPPLLHRNGTFVHTPGPSAVEKCGLAGGCDRSARINVGGGGYRTGDRTHLSWRT
ncbi:MAG: hypothetical protein JWO76_245 [Nocardioides sp.]|nr:hypothetical protein [Nocardioides sp.]